MKKNPMKPLLKTVALNKDFFLFDQLADVQKQTHQLRMEQTNISRLRLIGGLSILLELLLITLHDIPNFNRPGYDNTITYAYLLTHIFLLIVSCSAFVLGHYYYPKHFSQVRWWTPLMSQIHVLLFLSGISVITVIDQLTNGQIISFVTMFTFGGFFYYCKPPRQLWILGTPLVIFCFGIKAFQANSNIAGANITNGLLFGIAIMVASVFVYFKAQADLTREILLEDRNERLEFLAHHDSLTGLYNRRRFEIELAKWHETSSREYVYALGLMDLDYFKKVNDVFGHNSADIVLIQVANYLKEQIEPHGFIARWGGEEFIFLIRSSHYAKLIVFVDELRQGIEALDIKLMHQKVLITGSFGLTEVQCGDFYKMGDHFTDVDQALYHSKATGRNSVTFCENGVLIKLDQD